MQGDRGRYRVRVRVRARVRARVMVPADRTAAEPSTREAPDVAGHGELLRLRLGLGLRLGFRVSARATSP